MPFKPTGYTSVSPYLIVRDARKTLAFVKGVFNVEPLRVIPAADGGGIMHAEARIDDSVIMMGEQPNGPDSNVHVYLPDIEAAFERAKKAGGTVIQELERKGDGDLRGRDRRWQRHRLVVVPAGRVAPAWPWTRPRPALRLVLIVDGTSGSKPRAQGGVR